MREDGSVIVWANTQTTFTQRQDLAIILGIPLSKIRVVPTEVGGAFGGRNPYGCRRSVWPCHAALASRCA